MNEKKPSDQEIASAIAEAIRAKRGGCRASSAEELAAQEALLLADLESFQDSALDCIIENESARPPVANVSSGTAFPEIGKMGVNPPKECARPQPEVQAPRQASSVAATGLLAQLKQQAEQVNLQNSVQSKISAEASLLVNEGLQRVFEYLNELVTQLNVLYPVISREYTLFGVIEFKDLVWQRGFVDYRTNSNKMGDAAVLESVNFSFKIKFLALNAEQRERMFISEALGGKEGMISATQRARLKSMPLLTPGDFATVRRQWLLFDEPIDAERFLNQLEREHAIKPEVRQERPMGFVRH